MLCAWIFHYMWNVGNFIWFGQEKRVDGGISVEWTHNEIHSSTEQTQFRSTTTAMLTPQLYKQHISSITSGKRISKLHFLVNT